MRRALRGQNFLGLSGLWGLHLHGNRLRSLPAGFGRVRRGGRCRARTPEIPAGQCVQDFKMALDPVQHLDPAARL